MRPRSNLAPWVMLALLGLAGAFVASALLPPVALIVVMMVVLMGAFGIIAWRSPGGD